MSLISKDIKKQPEWAKRMARWSSWSRHRPFTATTWVRVPYVSPLCECSSMAEPQPSKLVMRVRFPSLAPIDVWLSQKSYLNYPRHANPTMCILRIEISAKIQKANRVTDWTGATETKILETRNPSGAFDKLRPKKEQTCSFA